MAQDRRALQWVIKIAQNVISSHLQSISDIGEVRCPFRARRILKDNTHRSHRLFTLLLLARDTEVTAAVPPDFRAASFPVRLLKSSSTVHQY